MGIKNRKVFHAWAYNTGENTKGSNHFYNPDNGVIYSYGTHFPMCRNVDNNTYLYTTQTHSTTANHLTNVRYAIPVGSNVINMQFIPTGKELTLTNMEHISNYREMFLNVKNLRTAFDKARVKGPKIDAIRTIINNVLNYTALFNSTDIMQTVSYYAEYIEICSWLHSLDTVAIDAADNAYLSKREKVKTEREIKQAKEREVKNAESIIKWRNFEINTLPYLGGIYLLRYNKETNTIETSGNVNVPVIAAMRLYAAIQCHLSKGANCGEMSIEHYKVKQLTDEYIIIGCHKILMSEVINCYESIPKIAGKEVSS